VRLTPRTARILWVSVTLPSSPSLPAVPSLAYLHLALLAVASQCRPPRASFYSYSIPSLCYFWGPLGLSNPENQKGERESETEKRFLPPPQPRPHPRPPTSDCSLRFLDSRFGRPRRRRFRELGKTGFFCPWRRGLIRSGPGAGVAP